jgi:fermentation-respiration switch protein FrsA (DUF1100 family)
LYFSRRNFLALSALTLTGCTSLIDKVVFSPTVGAVSPTDYVGGAPQILHTRVPDGSLVESWYFPPRSASHTVLAVFHGTAGNIGVIAKQAYPFLALGYGLFICDYRGYSANPGKPSEAGMVQDAAAQLATLRGLGVAPARTILFGHSLGGAATLLTASRLEAQGISHLGVVTWGSVASVSYMLPPVVGLLYPEKFDAISAVASISAPKVFMHGGSDTVVPPDSQYKLAGNAKPPYATIRVASGQHDFEADRHKALFAHVLAAVEVRNLQLLTALASADVAVAVKAA